MSSALPTVRLFGKRQLACSVTQQLIIMEDSVKIRWLLCLARMDPRIGVWPDHILPFPQLLLYGLYPRDKEGE